MKCQKCLKEFQEDTWQSGETYNAIDIHHNPPQFMVEQWKGDLINLCRKCHRDLHNKILEIMFSFSNLYKPKKSEQWTWLYIIGSKRKECIDAVTKFTMGWINEHPK